MEQKIPVNDEPHCEQKRLVAARCEATAAGGGGREGIGCRDGPGFSLARIVPAGLDSARPRTALMIFLNTNPAIRRPTNSPIITTKMEVAAVVVVIWISFEPALLKQSVSRTLTT